MVFEFDPDKSKANKTKHGIDFAEAQGIWRDERRVEFTARFRDEPRHGMIGRIGHNLWCAIFTYRDINIRLISVRRARDYEKETYHKS